MARDLVRTAAETPGADLSSLVGIGMGGAPIPPELVRRVAPVGAPSNGYGLTETTAGIAFNAGADYLAAPDAVGRPVPSADVRVVDPATGADLGEGAVGELWFRGPNVVRGYWNAPEATAAAFVDGWFRTGDLGRVDDGVVRVVDRLKDVVIRGGENVYCAAVEAELLEVEGVLDVAVVGVPHPTLGEEVAAVVVHAPGRRARRGGAARPGREPHRRVRRPDPDRDHHRAAAPQRRREGRQARAAGVADDAARGTPGRIARPDRSPRGRRTPHRPWKVGFCLARKASTASRWSCVAPRRTCACAS